MTAPVLAWQTSATFPLRGIDVSTHQRPEAYDPQYLDFVIARASYGDRPDFTAAAHARRVLDRPRADGTTAAFGVYCFLRHGTAENSKPANQLKAAREGIAAAFDVWASKPGTVPGLVWIDLEENSQFDGSFNRARARDIWERVISDLATEYRLGIYTAPGWFRAQFPDAPEQWRKLDYWLAHWGTATSGRPSPIVWGDGQRARILLWQFGLVDLNGQKIDGNVAALWPMQPERHTPAPPAPGPTPPTPTPSMPALLEQLAAELDAANAALVSAVQELRDLPTTHPARLHVERARSALAKARR
jgi:hypothetical protein